MQYDILLFPNHNWDGREMVFTSLIWYIIELANVTKTIILEIEDQFFSIVLFHIIIMFHNSFYKNIIIIFSIILSTSSFVLQTHFQIFSFLLFMHMQLLYHICKIAKNHTNMYKSWSLKPKKKVGRSKEETEYHELYNSIIIIFTC